MNHGSRVHQEQDSFEWHKLCTSRWGTAGGSNTFVSVASPPTTAASPISPPWYKKLTLINKQLNNIDRYKDKWWIHHHLYMVFHCRGYEFCHQQVDYIFNNFLFLMRTVKNLLLYLFHDFFYLQKYFMHIKSTNASNTRTCVHIFYTQIGKKKKEKKIKKKESFLFLEGHKTPHPDRNAAQKQRDTEK